MAEEKVELFNAAVCPFCHRTRLTLLEKGADFFITEIDLDDKPDWLPSVSPHGAVPAIRHGRVNLWESTVINEYLEDVFPTPLLMPQDPAERALARIWINFADGPFVKSFYRLLLEQEEREQHAWCERFESNLQRIEEGLGRPGNPGPYWFGEELTLTDITLYPWFERWPVLAHYRGLEPPRELSNLMRWWQTMSERNSVIEDSQKAEFYIDKYSKYADGTTQSGTAREMKE
jgi:glutathione S-transferase